MGAINIQHSGPWTVADVLALEEDRRYRYELLEGSLVISPAPSVRHQRASHRLANLLETAARTASARVEVLQAINVTLPSGLVVPDIVVADVDATAEADVSIDAQAVLLVIELVSLGSGTMDRAFKPVLYAEAAIPVYGRLESAPAPMLVISELHDGRYIEHATALAGVLTRVYAPFPFEIDPAQLVRR